MRTPFRTVAVIVAIIVMVATTVNGSVYAGSTGKTLSTNFTLVNLGSDVAVVNASYLKADGSEWPADAASTDFNIPANYGMNQVRQYFDNTMSAGQGSVVISSSQPLGAIVQIQARNQTPTQGAYSGYSAGSNKFYVPLAARQRTTSSGLANTQIIIQNADEISFTVTIELFQGATKSYTKISPTLQPGQSFYYDLADESNLPTAWIGSAVVTGGSNGKVTVVSNFFTGPDTMQTFNGFPSDSIGPRWVVPLFFSRLPNGLSTVVTVQNLNGASIAANAITLRCTRDRTGTSLDSFSVKNPSAIASNASYSFNPVTDTTLFPMSGWGGSCRVDAGTANIVAFAQLRYVGGATAGAAAYEAISETAATGKKLVVPLIAKRLGNGFASVVSIQNMDLNTSGGQSASVTLTYTPSFNAAECPVAVCDINKDGVVNASDKIVVGPLSIKPAASIQRNHRIASGTDSEPTLPSNWQGSLLVESSTSNINGFVQLTNYLNMAGDTFMAHNAFVQP